VGAAASAVDHALLRLLCRDPDSGCLVCLVAWCLLLACCWLWCKLVVGI